MNSLFTVIAFTFNNKVRSKAFLITSLVLLILLSVALHVPYLVSLFQSDKTPVIGAFEDDAGVAVALQAAVAQMAEPPFEVKLLADPGEEEERDRVIREEIKENDLKGVLVFADSAENPFPSVTYKSENAMGPEIGQNLQNLLYAIKNDMLLEGIELTDQQRISLFSPVQIEQTMISLDEKGQAKTEAEQAMAYSMVYVLMILQFMGIMITGQLIATEITAEKNTRVMEILVASIEPLKQMFGKIIGMLLIGLLQIGLFVAVGLINLNLPHNKDLLAGWNIDISRIPVSLLVAFIVFYLLGYFLYATLFAGVGSIVSRTEDLGQAIMPITLLSLAAFYIGLYGLFDPTSTFTVAMSYVPFFSPLLMFLRIGMENPAWWEIALSLLILAVSILFFGWLSAKIYRAGVLMYGKRPSLKELRKAMRSY